MRRAAPFALLLAAPALADVRLPAVIGEHMVLQRDSTVALWGWADPGEVVTVQADFLDAPVATTASAEGTWRVEVRTPPAGGPHSLRFFAANTIELLDVMSGEVWVCSGQSNMEWPLRATDHGDEDIAAADWPEIRLFDVTNRVSIAPLDDCEGAWSACSPRSVERFSAIGYHFGRELHETLGVPVGLIGSNWGGTPCRAWTSAAGLRQHGGFDDELARLDAAVAGDEDLGQTLEDRRQEWWQQFEEREPGAHERWMDADHDDSAWEESEQPKLWRDFGFGDHDGVVWLRREVTLPARLGGVDLVLELGPVDDNDVTWFNGVEIGAARSDGMWSTPRRYAVPGELVRAGRNVITICALDTGGAGGLSAGPEALRLVRELPGGASTAIPLAGQWRHRRGATMGELGAWPRDGWLTQHYPSALFNGMIAPISAYGIRGAIWYQGESDRMRAQTYRTLFPAMIRDWRQAFSRGDMPFHFVQIAPFRYDGDRGEAAELREAQALALALPNTGMAVTMDVGDPADIHPRDKRTVGHRLALWALSRTYGEEVGPYSGPLYRELSVVGNRARLRFHHAEGLRTRDGAAPSHLEIAGSDRVYHPAEASIEGRELVVWSPSVPAPVAVRYAWGAADEPNLENGAGLPAPSFRTDDWPGPSGP
jgi:sialate O-acetylesterase